MRRIRFPGGLPLYGYGKQVLQSERCTYNMHPGKDSRFQMRKSHDDFLKNNCVKCFDKAAPLLYGAFLKSQDRKRPMWSFPLGGAGRFPQPDEIHSVERECGDGLFQSLSLRRCLLWRCLWSRSRIPKRFLRHERWQSAQWCGAVHRYCNKACDHLLLWPVL